MKLKWPWKEFPKDEVTWRECKSQMDLALLKLQSSLMLGTLSNRDFIKSVRFGLIAVDVMGAARDFCGYANYPTSHDWDNLEQELRTDESFGLVGKHFTLARAPQEVVDCYRQELGGD